MRLQNKIFSGRVNTDADLSVFPDTDLLNAENVSYVIAADGRIAAVKPSKGNRKISASVPDSTVIGSYAEAELGRLYYLLYASDGAHRIMMFDQGAGTISTVAAGEFLGLQDTPITGIDKVGDILYWVQDDQEPKKMNVERGLRTYNSSYTSPDGITPTPYGSLTAQDITLIRPYPAYSPLATKQTLGLELNLIDTVAVQFALSFVYADQEISVLSPYSKLINYNKDDDTFDSIRVLVDGRQQIPNEVYKVRLHIRTGNTGSFFTIKEWDRSLAVDATAFDQHNSGTVLLGYDFNNNSNGVAISEEYSAKLFDSVPISSRALAAAKNRLFLGNNVFGLSKVTSGEIVATAASGNIGTSTVYGEFVFALAVLIYTQDNSYAGYNESLFVRITSLSDEENGYYDVTDILLPNRFFEGDLPPSVVLDPSMRIGPLSTYDLDINLTNYVAAKIPVYGAGYETTIIDSQVNRDYPGGSPSGDVQVYGIAGTPSGDIDSTSFKSGGRYRVGVVFYDFAGRSAGVYTKDDAIVSIPIRTYEDPAIYPSISVALTFAATDIPEWATHYQIVRTKNLTHQSFVQGFGEFIQYVGKDADGNWITKNDDNSFFSDDFDPDKVQGIAINLSPITANGLGYSFLDGDFVRIWFSDETTHLLQVIDTFGSYVVCQAKDLGELIITGKQHFFEITTPRKEFLQETFYEVGAVYPVSSPGTASRALSSTTITLSGDVSIKEREATGGSAFVEVMNPQDAYWKEWLTDIGRPNIVIVEDTRSVRPQNICYSNVRLASTQVNGLSSFDALDYVDLDSNSGPIRSLVITTRTQEYGSVMLAICETETNSIYLGETRIVDNAGAAIIATSGSVIGTVNNLRGSYGTVNPESVAVDEGRVYFVDRINGVVVQYAQNGLVPVSQNGMAAFFTEVLYELGASSRIWATVDGRTSEYCVYIPSGGIVTPVLSDYDSQVNPHKARTGMVWRYNPEVQGWDCAQDFTPNHLACINRWVISFDGSDLYVHDTDTMTYYGTAFKSLVSFPIGSGVMDVRLPQSVGIASDVAPEWVHVRNEEPYEQSTDLQSDEFVHTESMFYASFLRDRLSPGHESYEHALLFGEQVRGLYLPIAVRFDQNFAMNGIVIQYDISRGHPMLNTK